MNNRLRSAKLIDFVKEFALSYGEFTLSSGQKSNFFIDMSRVTGRSDCLNLICRNILDYLDDDIDWACHSVGGPVLGAAPIVGGLLAVHGNQFSEPLRGFMVRKEPKDGELIEGFLCPQDNVLIVEDVVTTGAQTKRAVEAVEATGATVRGIIAVVDRLGGARELLGDRFQAMMTSRDLEVIEKPCS